MATQKGKVTRFSETPKCIHQNIKFAIEIKKNGASPFLDVLVTR